MNRRITLSFTALLIASACSWWGQQAFFPAQPAAVATASTSRSMDPSPLHSVPPSPLPEHAAGSPLAQVLAPSSPESEEETGLSDMARLIASGWDRETHPAQATFRDWVQAHRHGSMTDLELAEGRRLAKERRRFLEEHLAADPNRVLAAAVPWHLRQRLPGEIMQELETRVDGRGEIQRLAVTPRPGQRVKETEWVEAAISGRHYRLYSASPDRQRSLATASLHGVAFGSRLAVTGSPVRMAEAGEGVGLTKTLIDVCPVSGKVTPAPPPVASPVDEDPVPPQNVLDVGESFIRLCGPAHLGALEARLAASEKAASPWIEQNESAGSAGTQSFFAQQPAASWTTGTKKCLIIRVDFSDLAGEPLSETAVSNTFNSANGVRAFYEQGSFSATSVLLAPAVAGDSPDVTPVFRLPQTASYYATSSLNGELHSSARTLATDAGFDLSGYDRVGVVFAWLGSLPGSQIDYGGLGNVEGKYFWINGSGSFDLRVVSHELGHNYGLPHAARQRVNAGSSAVADDGSWEEYGDSLDVMGGNGTMGGHFNMWAKTWLHWIGLNAVPVVTADGTYRIWRFDHPSAAPNLAAQPLALRIARRGDEEYWIGHRRALTSNADAMNGAYILWGYDRYKQTRLIDCRTPSDSNASNAPLPVGQSFEDSEAGIRITTVARGGTGGADEWLDVQVELTPRLETENAVTYVDEQSGFGRVLIRPVHGVDSAASANWSTTAGTALAGADFIASQGTLNWTPGNDLPQLLTVPLIPDALADNDEDFHIALSAVLGASYFSSSFPAQVRIRQPGAHDAGFVRGSWVNNTILTSCIDPSGRVLIGGFFGFYGASSLKGIGRMLADGREDTSFAPTQIDTATGPVEVIVTQPEGQILVGGGFTVQGRDAAHLVRLLEDGSTDTTFNIGTGPDDDVYAIQPLADGKILVGGRFTRFNGTTCRGLVRLLPHGGLDSTFVNPAFGNSWTSVIRSIALQSDGQILIGGQFYTNTTSPWRFSLARLSAHGVIDASFNIGHGAHAAGNPASAATVQKVELLSGGRIVVGGSFGNFNGQPRARMVVLNATGAIDTTSIATMGFNGTVYDLKALPDGRLIVAGAFTQTTDAIPAVTGTIAAFAANGALQPSFSDTRPDNTTVVRSVSFVPDSGRLLVAGDFATVAAGVDTPVYRLMSGTAGSGPVILQQPQGVEITQGSAHTLRVHVQASSPYCRWFKNGQLIAGADQLQYTIPTASAHDEGSYHAVIINAHGQVTSAAAAVKVNLLPVITLQPVNRVVNVGDGTTFSVNGTSLDSPLSFQWQKDTVDIPGAVDAVLTLPTTVIGSAGTYRCVLTNATGSVFSDAAVLTVVTPPTIQTQPQPMTVLAPAEAMFSVVASGLFLQYQWQRNEVDLPGQTAAALTLSSTTIFHSGMYRCRVSNTAGSLFSTAVELKVNAPPGIERQPTHRTVALGQPATLDLAALGPDLMYQWRKDQGLIPGANSASFTLPATTSSSAGTYRCRVSNPLGFVDSDPVILTVVSPPSLNAPLQPMSVRTQFGQPTVFAVTASGQFLLFQWRHNGQDIPSANGTSLTLTNPQLSSEGVYDCRVSNLAGDVLSPGFTLQVLYPPVITAQPQNATVEAQQPASFSVTATGYELSYQWSRNGFAIPAATAASYAIPVVTSAHLGSYTCQISNAAGSVRTEPALLAIQGMPVITREPFSVIAELGAPFELNLEASGESLSYLWKKGTTTVATQRVWAPGSMTSSLVGSYVAVVSNALHSVSAPPAFVSLTTTLNPAVDSPGLKWSTTGHGFWLPITGTQAHDGVDALATSPLADGQTALLATRMTGPLTLRWWQKISTQEGRDLFKVRVDGVDAYSASGERDWQRVSLPITAGNHLVEFGYFKDETGKSGQDKVWIDQIIPGPTYDVAAGQAHHLLRSGENLTLAVSVSGSGTPDAYQWRRNGVAISGARGTELKLTALTPARAGVYDCAVTEVINGVKTDFAGDPIQLGIVQVTNSRLVTRAGTRTVLQAITAGNGLSYQWRKVTPQGTTVLNGATSSTYTLISPQPEDSGSYLCQVTSPGGQMDAGTHQLVFFNAAPQLTQTGSLPDAILSGWYDYQIPFNSEAAVTPTLFVMSGHPAGLVIDKVTGRITGIPNVTRAAPYDLVITASNSVKSTVLKTQLRVLGLGTKVGAFVAMLPRHPTLNQNLGGRFDLTVTTTGAYSGFLTQGALRHSFSGRLAASVLQPTSATAENLVIVSKTISQTLRFTLTDAELLIDGTLTAGLDSMSFRGWKNPWSTTDPADGLLGLSTPLGLYTFGLNLPLSQVGVATTPQGTGFGSFTLGRTTGLATVSGRLADDTAYTFSTSVGRQGQWIFFTPLYSTAARGSLVGQPQIQLSPSQENHRLEGGVSWWSPPMIRPRLYASGMTQPMDLMMEGGRYQAPSAPTLALGLAAGINTAATLTFLHGGINQPPPSPDLAITLGTASRVNYPSARPRATTLTLVADRGTFSGGFTLEDPDPLDSRPPPTVLRKLSRKVSYQGLLIRGLSGWKGVGYFMLPQLPKTAGETLTNTPILSGQVLLLPAPPP